MTRPLLSVKEVAAELRISEMSVRRAYWNGEIPCGRIGRTIRLDLEEVREAIQAKGKNQALRAAGGRIGDSRPRGRRPR
jgi:excisionase family DNA binding protein